MNKKLDFTLMPVEFDDVVMVLQHSAESGKYEAKGWEKGKDFEKERNLASIRRHFNEYRMGNYSDVDTGLHPLLHVACRALMQYTLDKRAAKEGEVKSDLEFGFIDSRTGVKYPISTPVFSTPEVPVNSKQNAIYETNKPSKIKLPENPSLRCHITTQLCGIPNCKQCEKERKDK